MNLRNQTLKRLLAGLLLAANVLTVNPVQAEETVAPAAAPRSTSRPRVRQIDWRNGDGDGVMDDEEKALVNKGESRPTDAADIGRYTVTEDQDLYTGGGTAAQIQGKVKKDEFFSVVLPGERYSRIRLKDGRLGWIDKSKIVKDGINTNTDERGRFTSAPGGQSGSKQLEAGCATCDAKVPMPEAIGGRKINDIAKISRHLNQKPNRTRVPDATDEILGVASGRLQRLVKAGRHQAMMCRVPATYLWGRRGRGQICGNHSKGKCYSAVKDALVEAGFMKTRLPGVAAKDAHYRGYLKAAGMKNIMPQLRGQLGGNLVTLAQSAPAGSILVYDGGGHGYGHIETKTTKSEYCSDFCRGYPVNVRNARRLIGIYVP